MVEYRSIRVQFPYCTCTLQAAHYRHLNVLTAALVQASDAAGEITHHKNNRQIYARLLSAFPIPRCLQEVECCLPVVCNVNIAAQLRKLLGQHSFYTL